MNTNTKNDKKIFFERICCTVCDFFDEKVSNFANFFTLPDGNQQFMEGINMIDNEIRKQYRQVINDLKSSSYKNLGI